MTRKVNSRGWSRLAAIRIHQRSTATTKRESRTTGGNPSASMRSAGTSPNAFSKRNCFPEILSISPLRSEEHTSELQSHHDLVCRLLLEKKNNTHRVRQLHHQHPPTDRNDRNDPHRHELRWEYGTRHPPDCHTDEEAVLCQQHDAR